MCGATDQQKDIADQQQQFYKMLDDNYTTMFGQQQHVLSALTSTFQPILDAGPLQAGYSPAEATALDTSASENIAQSYAANQRTVAQNLAARGGDTLLPSSTTAQILATGSNQAAAQRAAALNTNLTNNYQLGYQNWTNAAQVLGQVAGLQNPNAYAGSSNTAGSDAATSANNVAMAANSPWNAAIGAVGALGGAALGNPAGLSNIWSGSKTPFTTTVSR